MEFEEEIQFLTSGNVIAVTPHHDGTHLSIIHTHQGILHSKGTEEDIINRYCNEYGSSLEGRRQGSRKLLDIKKRPPVIISERLQLVAMQLPAYNTIGTVYILDLKFTIQPHLSYSELIFTNGFKLKVGLKKSAVNDHKAKAFELRDKIVSQKDYQMYISFSKDPQYT